MEPVIEYYFPSPITRQEMDAFYASLKRPIQQQPPIIQRWAKRMESLIRHASHPTHNLSSRS